MLDALARTTAEAAAASLADFVLHPVITAAPDDPAALASDLAADGCVSVKMFTHMAGFTARPARYLDLIAAAARHDLTVMAHCEDPALGEYLSGPAARRASRNVLPAGRHRGGGGRPDGGDRRGHRRPDLPGAPVQQPVGGPRAGRPRARGPAAAGNPARVPAADRRRAGGRRRAAAGHRPGGRGPADLSRLWQAVSDGRFDAICTDHAPWREAPGKLPASGARSVRSGLSCLELSRSLLFMKGVLTGRMTLPQLAELTAAGPARAFGLYPAKGVIAVGSDADLAVFDPAVHWRYSGGQSPRGMDAVRRLGGHRPHASHYPARDNNLPAS